MKPDIICLAITIICIQTRSVRSQLIHNATTELQQGISEELKNPIIRNETPDDLVESAERKNNQANTVDYPAAPKLESDYPEEITKQTEKLTTEDLNIKCQHLLNTQNKPTYQNGPNLYQNIANGPNNHRPYASQIRPVYIPQKTTSKPKPITTPKPYGFYITHSNIATQKPTVSTPPRPIKYVQLEPLILQKTILNDGRTLYYWHRSLPGTVEIPRDTTENNYISTTTNQGYIPYKNNYGQLYSSNHIPHVYPSVYGGSSPYGFPWPQNTYPPNSYVRPYTSYTSREDNLMEEQKPTESTTESSTTTTTTEHTSYGYGLGSFFPFYSYGQDTGSTTTQPASTAAAVPGPVTDKLKTDELLYAQQLRFIVPVPYEDLNGGTSVIARYPWDVNQHPYYPKVQQPNGVNVPVPYNPPLYMVRAVAVPNFANKNE